MENKLSEQEITEVVIRDFLRNDERIIRTEMQDQCCGLIQRFINKMNKGMSTPNAAENLKQEILLRFSPFLKQGGLDYTENLSAQMDLYANATLTRERERVKPIIEALGQAVSVIKQWHNADEVWDIYFNNAPEMKLIKQALNNYKNNK